jgi:hypothetical protein
MAHNKNQHFVPQYYFRLFSTNTTMINSLLKSSGEIKENIKIRNQCSKAYFYGSVEVEKRFGVMEGEHSKLLQKILIINSKDDLSVFLQDNKNRIILIEIILFQRLRTSLENNKMSEMIEKLAKELLKTQLTVKGEKKLLKSLPNCDITLNKKWKQHLLLTQIASIHNSQPALFDLEVCILNNQTERKFIFSDSPVVFYNKAYRHIKDRGTIGLQSPGLLIFFPISDNKCLLFIDKSKYTSNIIDNQFYNITEEFDINSINKLQLHHSMNTVYFSQNTQYNQIKKLWKQERNDFDKSYCEVNTVDEIIDGKVSKNSNLTISHLSHIPYELNLSFLQPNIKRNETINHYRDKELYNILQESKEEYKKIKKEVKNELSLNGK